MKQLLLLIALSLFPLTVHSESTAEMLSNCRPITKAKIVDHNISMDHTFGTGVCWGAFGTFQGLSRFLDERGGVMLKFCPPKEARRSQLIAVFVKYADDNPQLHHEGFDVVAVDALVKAFPCSK